MKKPFVLPVLIAALSLTTFGCNKNSAAEKQKPAAKARGEETLKPANVDPEAELAAEAPFSVTPIRAPFILVPEFQLIDGNYTFTELPLGYGLEKSFGKVPDYKTKTCVALKPEVWPGNATYSRFGHLEDAYDVEERADIFASWRREVVDGKSLNPEITEFVDAASKNLGAESVAYGYAGRTVLGSIQGFRKDGKVRNGACDDASTASTHYVDSIQFGFSYLVVLRVNFRTPNSANAWKKAFSEDALTSVFADSRLKPAAVSSRLKKIGASVEILVLQSGDNKNATEATLKELGCSIENVAACRSVVTKLTESLTTQIPAKLTLENWKQFGVMGFDVRLL